MQRRRCPHWKRTRRAAPILVGLMVSALSVVVIGPCSAVSSLDISVSATARPPGVDTGFDVVIGSLFHVEASGYASYGPDKACGVQGYPLTDADGTRYIGLSVCSSKLDSRLVLPTAPVGALLGRIGSGPWFLIGRSAALTAAQSGRLYLLYNDIPTSYGDNVGSYTVQVSLISAPVGSDPNSAQIDIIGLSGQATFTAGQCVTLELKVRFKGSSDSVDVTRDPNTSFFTDPPGGTFTGNMFCASPGEVNHTFPIYGRYRDPGSGATVSDAVVVQVLPPQTLNATVTVPASRDLQGVDTGVDVVIGSQIQFSATGRAVYGYDTACGFSGSMHVDPDGVRYPHNSSCAPKYDPVAVLPTAPIGALLGRIDTGPWFFIGSSASHTVTGSSGRLTLLFNDDSGLYGDNTGNYQVSITVQ